MKRPRAHQIDARGDVLLRSVLPSSWQISVLSPDYGKDYLVEVAQDDALTGEAVVIQLKSTMTPRYGDGGRTISHSVKKDHLQYYFTHKLPVFLVIADVNAGRAYWVFLQEYLSHHSRWGRRASFPIAALTSCDLHNTARLIKAITAAQKFVSARHPGVAQAALLAEKQRIESADPRFIAEVSATATSTHVRLHAKEDVLFQLQLSGPPDLLKAGTHKLLALGEPLVLGAVKAELIGLPGLLPEGFVASKLVVTSSIPVELAMYLCSDTGRYPLGPVAGLLEGGTAQQRFSSRLGLSPCVLTAQVSAPHATEPRTRVSYGYSIQPAAWIGQPIASLAYFGAIARFVAHMAAHGDVEFVLSSQGETLYAARRTLDPPAQIGTLQNLLELMDMIRTIESRLPLGLCFPQTITPADVHAAQYLHQLVTVAGLPHPFGGQEFITFIPHAALRERLADEHNPFGQAGQGVYVNSLSLPLFGRTVLLEDVRSEVSSIRIADVRTEAERWVDSHKDGDFPLRITTPSDATILTTYSRVHLAPEDRQDVGSPSL
jgi:hypothetical protein